jgi:hypothetical protein
MTRRNDRLPARLPLRSQINGQRGHLAAPRYEFMLRARPYPSRAAAAHNQMSKTVCGGNFGHLTNNTMKTQHQQADAQ